MSATEITPLFNKLMEGISDIREELATDRATFSARLNQITNRIDEDESAQAVRRRQSVLVHPPSYEETELPAGRVVQVPNVLHMQQVVPPSMIIKHISPASYRQMEINWAAWCSENEQVKRKAA